MESLRARFLGWGAHGSGSKCRQAGSEGGWIWDGGRCIGRMWSWLSGHQYKRQGVSGDADWRQLNWAVRARTVECVGQFRIDSGQEYGPGGSGARSDVSSRWRGRGVTGYQGGAGEHHPAAAWGAEPYKASKLGAGTLTTLSGTQPLLPQASDSTYCRHPDPGPLVHSASAVTSRSPRARSRTPSTLPADHPTVRPACPAGPAPTRAP